MIEQVPEQLQAYLASETTLEEFENWFHPATWSVRPDDTRVGSEVSEMRLDLAEFDRGDRSEAELKAELRQLLGRIDKSQASASPRRPASRIATLNECGRSANLGTLARATLQLTALCSRPGPMSLRIRHANAAIVRSFRASS